MKFKFSHPVKGKVRTYGGLEVKDGDTIDSQSWGDKEGHFITQAKKDPAYEVINGDKGTGKKHGGDNAGSNKGRRVTKRAGRDDD